MGNDLEINAKNRNIRELYQGIRIGRQRRPKMLMPTPHPMQTELQFRRILLWPRTFLPRDYRMSCDLWVWSRPRSVVQACHCLSPLVRVSVLERQALGSFID